MYIAVTNVYMHIHVLLLYTVVGFVEIDCKKQSISRSQVSIISLLHVSIRADGVIVIFHTVYVTMCILNLFCVVTNHNFYSPWGLQVSDTYTYMYGVNV